MVAVAHAPVGTEVNIMTPSGPARATVVERPFYDPKKKLAAA
jgi:aminomethyltransferase